jgi:putative FmdB family regulatory protein
MPTYEYECPKGHVHEEFKTVAQRETNECPICGSLAKIVITPVHLDYLNCGVDMDFPTAASKWEKMQRNKGSGKQWDSNNLRYGGDYERKRS